MSDSLAEQQRKLQRKRIENEAQRRKNEEQRRKNEAQKKATDTKSSPQDSSQQSKKSTFSKLKSFVTPNVGSKIGSNVKFLTSFIGILHTLIKFLPLGLYFFAYLSSALFKDLRSALLLVGLIINDIIGYIHKKYTKGIHNPNCDVFSSNGVQQVDSKTKNNYYGEFLQNPHTEIISFVASFFYSDMFYKQKLDILPFSFLTIMIFLTVWSRMALKCKNKFSDVIVNIIFGFIRGFVYYYFIKTYYLQAERGVKEKEACDLGLKNYRCDEIKNGTVIIKEPNLNKETNFEEDEDNDDF